MYCIIILDRKNVIYKIYWPVLQNNQPYFLIDLDKKKELILQTPAFMSIYSQSTAVAKSDHHLREDFDKIMLEWENNHFQTSECSREQ